MTRPASLLVLRCAAVGLSAHLVSCGDPSGAGPADTDATTSPNASSSTDGGNPPLDSTDGSPATVGPDTDTGMTEGETDDSDSTSDDGPMGCTGDDECTEADAPFCVDMVCSACSAAEDPDGACAEKFPETPACVASMCVQCSAAVQDACTGTTPICDVEASTCVGCTSHDQCPDSACHIPDPARASNFDGACFDPTTVVHVDGDGGQAFTTIGAAVNAFGVGEEGVIIVHAASSYDETVSVDGNRVLAIFAANGDGPVWTQGTPGAGPGLSVSGTSTTIFLHEMRLSGSDDPTSPAIAVNAGRVHIQRSAIVNNDGGGIAAENGALLYVENSFVGHGTSARHAITVDGASASILFSSLVSGFDNFSDVYAIACTNPQAVAVRNSFLASSDNSGADLDCEDAVVTYTASQVAILGAGNVALGPVGPTWFDNFNAGDFHLNAPPAPLATTAQWQTGDPLTDIDGQPRPNTDGAMDYAGADIP